MIDRIRAKAIEIGFDRVGFSDLEEPEEAEHLFRWLAEGRNAGMQYMERGASARARPSERAPWARSAVVVLKSYAGAPSGAGTPRGSGRVARYALGPDYHDAMRARLEELARWIAHEFAARSKAMVDTSAILERAFARKAGLGWVGKNSMLIDRKLGSFFFIGEILTDLRLGSDLGPARPSCGRCTRCLRLCPTGAIVAPYVLDARKCISYLTIEHRGVIDRKLRPLMGNLIFGCDICQDVCPWNKRAQRADARGLDPGAERLGSLMSLTEAEFRRRFKGSAILRAKRDGFLRNVAIALGNSGLEQAVEPLERGLADPSWLVRLHSAWGLGRLGRPRSRQALERRLAVEEDPRVREEIQLALA